MIFFLFFWLFSRIREGVSLLLLLFVTKQQSSLAPAVSAGDVGVRDPSSAGAMSSASGVILVHRGGWGIFAADMLFLSGLSRLAVTFEVLNERKAHPLEGVPSGVCTEYFKERGLMLNL